LNAFIEAEKIVLEIEEQIIGAVEKKSEINE
jgi:hypothetical protein